MKLRIGGTNSRGRTPMRKGTCFGGLTNKFKKWYRRKLRRKYKNDTSDSL